MCENSRVQRRKLAQAARGFCYSFEGGKSYEHVRGAPQGNSSTCSRDKEGKCGEPQVLQERLQKAQGSVCSCTSVCAEGCVYSGTAEWAGGCAYSCVPDG